MEGKASYLVRPLDAVRVESCGCAAVSPPWSHPSRTLDSHVLLLGLRGHVPLVEDGREFELQPGTLALLRAGHPHKATAPIEHYSRYYWVHFRAHITPWSLTNTSTTMGDSVLFPQSVELPDRSQTEKLFARLLFTAEGRAYTDWKLRVAFLELAIHITEELLANHQAPEEAVPGLVHRTLCHITEDRENANLSIKSLAYLQGVNPDYLGRVFKSSMGTSVGEYIAQHRVDAAMRFLEDTGLSNSLVAAHCGFGSVRQFVRVFKRISGFSPGDYRRSLARIHTIGNRND